LVYRLGAGVQQQLGADGVRVFEHVL